MAFWSSGKAEWKWRDDSRGDKEPSTYVYTKNLLLIICIYYEGNKKEGMDEFEHDKE